VNVPPLTVSASIVSARLLDLREELDRLRAAGVHGVHVDIEDGRFVPELNLGLRVAFELGDWGGLPVDVHLMVEDPERVLALLDGAAVDAIAVHLEATRYPRRTLRLVRESGRRAGLALNPATPLPEIEPLLPYLDYLLMLTTEAEHDAPAFLPSRLDAVSRLAAIAARHDIPVIVDGAVSPGNAAAVAAAGARGVVVGRALFAAEDLSAAVRAISAPGAAA